MTEQTEVSTTLEPSAKLEDRVTQSTSALSKQLGEPPANNITSISRQESKHEAPMATCKPVAKVPTNTPIYSVFTIWEKRFIVLAATLSAFFSPLNAQIYYPALNTVAQDLHVTLSQANLTITTYMVVQAITPAFIGEFADNAGRRPAYVICFVVYVASNIGCALAPNYAALLVIRMLQSAGSSGTVALCYAVVTDIATSAERGQWIGYTSVPIVLAPSLGPVIGGLLSQYLGWKSIFWFLAILGGVCGVIIILFLPETCRKVVGDGSIPPRRWNMSILNIVQARKRRAAGEQVDDDEKWRLAASRKISFPNPLSTVFILFKIEASILLLYSGLVLAGFYALGAAIPSQFKQLYGFNDITIGLMFLPMAAGSVLAAFTVGKAVNWNYSRHCKRLGILVDKKSQPDLSNFPIERARLEVGYPLILLSGLLYIYWGWALHFETSYGGPMVLLFLLGYILVAFCNMVSILLVDIHPGRAGTASAANNLTKCLLGAASSALVVPMIDGIGVGWCFTIIGLLYIALSPVILLIMRRGIEWRKQEKRKLEEKERKKDDERRRIEGRESGTVTDHK